MSTEQQAHPLYQLNLGEAVDQGRKRAIDAWLITQINAFIIEKNFEKSIESPFKLTDDEVNYVSGRLEGKPSETWDVKIAVTPVRSGLQRGFQQFEIQCIKKTPQEVKKEENKKKEMEDEALFLEFLSEFLHANGVGYLVPAVCTPGFMAYGRRDQLPTEYLRAFELFKQRKAEEKRKEAAATDTTDKDAFEKVKATYKKIILHL